MAQDSGDAACLSALETQLGHAPPFTEAELAGVQSLTVTHAHDLALLGGCAGLTHLRVIASELADLLVCDQLPELTHLEIHASKLGSLAGAAFCTKLAQVDLLFTSLDDASDLLGIEAWSRGTVIGNPWTETSWGALRHAVRERPDLAVALDSEENWKHCTRLWERAQAVFGALPGGASFVVRPGLPTLTQNAYDALQVGAGTVDSELDSASFQLAKLFTEYKSQLQAPALSELAADRTLGSSQAAAGWIASSALAADDKAALTRFVQRFPSVRFYRTSDAALDRAAQRHGITLPARYRAIRAAVDGWFPDRAFSAARFDRFEGASPRSGRVASLSYLIGLREHGDDVKEAMHAAGVVNIGLSREQPLSTLAIRLGDADPQVYEYSDEDINDAISERRDVKTSLYPVFPSYAAMLDHVVAIQPEDDPPIAAA